MRIWQGSMILGLLCLGTGSFAQVKSVSIGAGGVY